MRVFLDANVLFSAAKPGSNIHRLITTATNHSYLVTSDLAFEEARRNILVKRAAWSATFYELVKPIELAPTALFELPVFLEEKDRPILCSAIRSRCEYLVTGDFKHFGALITAGESIRGVTVISMKQFAELLFP